MPDEPVDQTADGALVNVPVFETLYSQLVVLPLDTVVAKQVRDDNFVQPENISYAHSSQDKLGANIFGPFINPVQPLNIR